ncbi:MAG TPA: hypothetical protein VHS03_13455, partial [Gaiellaceae bacterium]|nr:hypothetical protein [Gaiellaceae bacterium]
GIFDGLELTETPAEGSTTAADVYVSPGLAIDGFGREIVVSAPFKLDASLFLQPTLPAGWTQVWIRYFTEPVDPAGYGYELCDDPNLTTRTRQTFKIQVGQQQTPYGDVVIAGQAIHPADLTVVDESVPYQALPEDADDDRWLVPLGWVNWDGVSGFVKSTGTLDDEQRVKDRVYGGDVSGHTYPPDDNWELVSRRVTATGDPPARAHGIVRGDLTVEDLLVVKDQGIELWASPLTFTDTNGPDPNKPPLVVSREDKAGPAADLHIQIGKDAQRKNRLVIDGSKTERVVIYDNGDMDVAGDLKVAGIVDLSAATGDRVYLGETLDTDETAAIGTEGGGDSVYARARTSLGFYIDKKPDAGVSARMILDGSTLSVRGNQILGAGGNGYLRVREIHGKDWQSDAEDDLFLNWNNGKHVHVGGGAPANLYVSGNIFVGANEVPLNFDLQVGATHVALQGTGSNPNWEAVTVSVPSVLPHVNHASLLVSLRYIHNVSTANDAMWAAYWDGAQPVAQPGNQYDFTVWCGVGDTDGFLDDISWIAIFT